MATFQTLDQKEEDELHKSRLLNVEEKPFKRLTKRLLVPGSVLSTPGKLPTPPPDNATSEDPQSTIEDETQKILEERRQFREDIVFDFAAFESAISRFQFLQNSNQKERERYEADKQRILDTAQNVRNNTAQLRVQLEEAQRVMAQRKKFDALAEKIYNNKMLRPREDQAANLLKLEEECRELERESETYTETWKERRQQFDKIVEEGLQLRRLIRDEKEEVERREGMDGGGEDGEVGDDSRGGQTPKYSSQSGNATPRPDGTRQGTPDIGGSKLRPLPSDARSRASSKAGSRAASRVGSRAGSPEQGEAVESQISVEEDVKATEETSTDVVMEGVESTPVNPEADAPHISIEVPPEDRTDGEEKGDQMDTT